MLRIERRPGPVRDVLVVTIDRPERRNAVDLDTLQGLRDVAGDETVGAVVLTGAPPAFCAGADLSGVDSEEFGVRLTEALTAWGDWSAVRIAAIDGPALGAGTQLALVCDLRVATAESRFGIPAARLGLAVDQWTVDRLTEEFGWPIARSILLTAERVDAATLHRTGAVHRIGTVDEAVAWAEEIVRLAPLSLDAHRAALSEASRRPARDTSVDEVRARAWASADAVEGRAAFAEKRDPRFTGR
ncbi:MAG: enoyl-CoA hydratase-related protein [Ilumatobacter sp.]